MPEQMRGAALELAAAKQFLLELTGGRGAPVVAAVSGGVDSMCLLHLLYTWGAERGFFVTAAHFNHQLRGAEADRDEQFVRAYCAGHGIPFVAGRGDTRALARERGLSEEEAARDLRYAFLERTAEEGGCAFLLTAHHADDNAETVLLNLLRGTGSAGLGIPARRGRIARPFLAVTRGELAAYAERWGVPHVEDSTNADTAAASRNLLRRQVLPVLKSINPRAVENMARASVFLAEESAALDKYASELLALARPVPDGSSIPRAALTDAPEPVAARAALALCAQVCGRRQDLGSVEASMLLALAAGRTRGPVALSHGLRARRTGGLLLVERVFRPPEPAELRPGKPVRFGEWGVRLAQTPGGGETVSLMAEAGALSVTAWRPSDRLQMANGRSRSFKRICTDRGIPAWDRDRLPVVRIGEAAAAAPGVGVSASFAPKPGERAVLITFNKYIEEKEHEK